MFGLAKPKPPVADDDPDKSKPSVADAKTIYQHLSNCQDYLTYNSDEVSIFPRRVEFRKSIEWLKNASEYGIRQVYDGKRGKNKPDDVVWDVRQFGNSMASKLLDNLKGDKDQVIREAAAIRLSIALDAVHKSILVVSLFKNVT